MKNIIVFSHLYKPHLGGLEKYVENFYKNLPEDTKITIITSKHLKTLPEKEINDNLLTTRLDCIEILKGKYFIPSIKGYKQIKEIFELNKKKNTIVHTHTRFYLTNVIGSYLSKKYKLNHYHFEHGSSFVKDGSLIVKILAYIFDKTFAKYILNNAKLVFPISLGVKDFLRKNFKNIKYGPIIYNSYDFKTETIQKKERPKSLKLLFVGRLIKSKGIYELIDACKLLSEEKFPYSLAIIGDGSERLNLIRYVKEKDLEKYINILGPLPFEKTQKEYKKHHMLINPSYTEGLPTTVLEALANGLLIVGTDVGGTSEIIDKDSLIQLDDLSSNSISKKINDFYNNWDNVYTKLTKDYTLSRVRFDREVNTKKYYNSIDQ